MRREAPGRGRLGRLLRYWRLDRNPLRRTVDRVEAFAMAALCVVFLAGAPWVALAAGQWAAAAGMRVERAQADWRQVPAVVLGTPSATAPARSQASLDPQAQARWRAPDGAARAGQIRVPGGVRAGTTVPVWVDQMGRLTAAPLQPSDVVDEAALAAMLAFLGWAGALAVAGAATHLAANGRRLAAWGVGWSVAGPQWTGRR